MVCAGVAVRSSAVGAPVLFVSAELARASLAGARELSVCAVVWNALL